VKLPTLRRAEKLQGDGAHRSIASIIQPTLPKFFLDIALSPARVLLHVRQQSHAPCLSSAPSLF
jgi:hypothetical protein